MHPSGSKYQERTKKNTLVCIRYKDLTQTDLVRCLDDVKVVFTDHLIVIIHGPAKEVLVEQRVDVSEVYMRRLDTGE